MPMAAPISNQQFSNIMNAIQLKAESRLCIAVSGGADSMCLLMLAQRWCQENNHSLIAVTVNHGLRKEAKDEAASVKNWCKQLQCEHYTLDWKGKKPSSNIQSQAREIRYQLIQQFCQQQHIKHVLLAHHLQDQAETLLIRMMRGSGVSGLKGMESHSTIGNISLLRPLLSFTKEDILLTLNQLKQSFINDPSNENTRFLRVIIRNFINTIDRKNEVLKHIDRTAKHMQRADDFIQQQLLSFENDFVNSHPYGFVTIDKKAFQALHLELALRLVSKNIQHINGYSATPRIDEIERLHLDLLNESNSRLTLGGCVIQSGLNKRDNHLIYIMRETNSLNADSTMTQNECIFDGRFHCTLGDIDNKENYRLSALKQSGWQQIKDYVNTEKLPKEIFYALPALKQLEKVIAVPHIGFLARDVKINFSSYFLPLKSDVS